MIQDIAPYNFDNQYKNLKPSDDSFVISIKDGNVLLSEGKEEIFPVFGQVKNLIDDYEYLFSIDNKSFYLSEDSVGLQGYKYVSKEIFRILKPKHMAFAGVTAIHIKKWYNDNRYCGQCGNTLSHDKKQRVLRCNSCGNTVYPRIDPAVIVAVTNGNKLLLTRYKNRDYKRYSLIAGFNEIGESMEETVKREVMEEAGVKVKNIRYYKSQPWGFADDILMGYFCEVDGDDTITMDEEELSEAVWVERNKISVEFDDLSLTNEMIFLFKEGKNK